jgi:hypothetical protein
MQLIPPLTFNSLFNQSAVRYSSVKYSEDKKRLDQAISKYKMEHNITD